MSPGWGWHTTRAAVFAAVCVLLATLGHVLMSDTALPWWALGAAVLVTGAAAWCLAARERGLLLVSSAVVTVQAVLHLWFSYAQELSATAAALSAAGEAWSHSVLYTAIAGESAAGHAHHAAHVGHGHASLHPLTGSGSVAESLAGGGSVAESLAGGGSVAESLAGGGGPEHTMAGMSSTGMLAAHLLAALLCGLWLAHGERAAFRILRAVAARLAAPLRLLLALPAPPHRPRIRLPRVRAARNPRRLLLVHTLTSRGPPAGPAVLGALRPL
ncbi:hypothetical protein GCM10009601_02420 [Streptomyces thermospinosisporus]|uniref:PE-PGRS family protein n=1 Tax=Streptomyces thermospinosisporus TaxID=161482 RepID=A0ABN1YK27_9ACTN